MSLTFEWSGVWKDEEKAAVHQEVVSAYGDRAVDLQCIVGRTADGEGITVAFRGQRRPVPPILAPALEWRKPGAVAKMARRSLANAEDPERAEKSLVPMKFALVAMGRLASDLADFCLLETAEIITTCKQAMKGVRLGRRTQDTGDQGALARGYLTRRDLTAFVDSKDFALGPFLEVLYYVVSIVDSTHQHANDRDLYFQVRVELQPRLYDALVALLGMNERQLRDVEGALIERAEEYCADIRSSDAALRLHLAPYLGTGPWILELPHTAFFYAMELVVRGTGVLINGAEAGGRYDIRCPSCGGALKGKVGGELYRVACPSCGAAFDVATARWLAAHAGS